MQRFDTFVGALRYEFRMQIRGVNSCPNLLTNLDTGRFRRPGSVRPVGVPARFRQVISPGVASQANKAGTLPLKPARAPPPSRVCSSAYGPGLDHWDCPPQASPAWRLARQGVDHPFTRKVELEVVVSFWIANATPDKTSDAYWLRHYDRHSPHTDTPDIGTLSPTFLSPTRRCGMRTSLPWRRIWSNIAMSHGGSLRP
jgi:hypothetical protein